MCCETEVSAKGSESDDAAGSESDPDAQLERASDVAFPSCPACPLCFAYQRHILLCTGICEEARAQRHVC